MNRPTGFLKNYLAIAVLGIIFSTFSITTVLMTRNTVAETKQVKDLVGNAVTETKVIESLVSEHEQFSRLSTAQEACIIKESVGFELPGRSAAEVTEMVSICKDLLGGDALEYLRSVLREK